MRVALDLDGRGDGLDERPEIGDPAGSVELLTPPQLDLDRERVDALAPLEKRLGRGVDPLVPRDEEVIDTQEVDDLEDRVAVREQAPKHLLLGGFVEGDLAVRADVDHAE